MRNEMQRNCPWCGRPMNGRHLTDGCGVDAEMRLALRTYSASNGRTWKFKLRTAWMNGEDVGSALQRVRNVVGPTDLEKVKVS